MRSFCPASIVFPRYSTVRVAVRHMFLIGLTQRSISSTAGTTSARSALSRSHRSGSTSSWYMPPDITWRVVSSPPMRMSSDSCRIEWSSSRSPSTSACTRMLMRSSRGHPRRSSITRAVYSLYPANASIVLFNRSRSSVPSPRRRSSDHRSRSSRSSGSTPSASPIMMSGTQAAMSQMKSHSPRSHTSSTSAWTIRWIPGSCSRTRFGVKPLATSLRRLRCSGSSMSIIIGIGPVSGRMPPAFENVVGSDSISLMWSYRAIPQTPPSSSQCTGSCSRIQRSSPCGLRPQNAPLTIESCGGRTAVVVIVVSGGDGESAQYRLCRMIPTSVPGLDVTHDGSVLTLTLDRSERRNAIDDVMMAGLIDAITAAGTDEAVRVVLLRGAGDDFCSGADIVARNAPGGERPRAGSIQRRLPTQSHRLIPLLLGTQVPVVCAVHGWAAGLGFQLALAADLCIAAADAIFWEPFGERGFTPDSGATWMLPRRVGDVRARELLLLGRRLSGTEAAEWGAIHRAVPAEQLTAETDALVAQLAG